MKSLLIPFLALFLLPSSAFARTPGDAALRAGHPQQAAELYKKGAELGHADAAFKLGFLINNKQVAAQDFGKATLWYEMACQLGHEVACHNLGVFYEYGQDENPKNFSKAYEYYLKAAEKDYLPSQYNLASLYSNNYLKPRNNLEGYKWMLIARNTAEKCKKKNKLCQWILDDPPGHMTKLKKRLSKTQIEHAKALADSWQAKK